MLLVLLRRLIPLLLRQNQMGWSDNLHLVARTGETDEARASKRARGWVSPAIEWVCGNPHMLLPR